MMDIIFVEPEETDQTVQMRRLRTKLPSGKTPAQKHGAVSKRKTVAGAKQPSLQNGSCIAHDLTSFL
ncbi:hypothetical protein [Escherichia coli]|nr:hypothetical protein [Escherichia coli]